MAVSILGPQVILRLVAVIPSPWSRCQVTATLPSIVSCILLQILVAHVLLILLTRLRGGMLGLIASLCPTQGGGNRSTRRTKTCTLGTESPNQEGGDAKWHSLTSLKFSTLLGRFAFRQYLRLQQKSLAARGNRSQTEGSGVHEIRMAQLADKIPSCSTIRTSRGDSGILMGTALLGRGTIQKSKMQLIQEACLGLALEREQMVLWNKFKRFPFIALVIVGSESPSLLAVA